MKEIKIKPANNGWIVDIGCQTFVAENKDKMLSEIGRYIEKPDEVEKEYTENAKNKDNAVTVSGLMGLNTATLRINE